LNDRLYLPTSVLFSTLFVTLVGAFLLFVPPSTAGHLLRWHAPAFNPVLRALGYSTSRENLGYAVKAFWLTFMYGAHALECVTALPNTLYTYSIEKWQYRAVYVRFSSFCRFHSSTDLVLTFIDHLHFPRRLP
jgi:hypothetical protein